MNTDTLFHFAASVKQFREAHLALSAEARKVEGALSRQKPLDIIRALVAAQGQTEHKADVLKLQLMQFLVSTLCAYESYRQQDLTEIGNWIGWALSPKIEEGVEVTVETSRLQAFENVAFISTWPELPSLLVMFFSSFFYYARSRVAMRNVALEFWPLGVLAFRRAMGNAPFVQVQDALLGSHLLEWAVKEAPDLAKALTPTLESWGDDKLIPRDVRAYLCVSMSTLAGKHSTRPADEWASKALAEFGDVLDSHTRIQLRSAIPALDSGDELNNTLVQIRKLQAEQKKRLSPVNFERYAGQNLDSITPLIRRAFLSGNYDPVIRILEAWYLPDEVESTASPRFLITVPFDMTGWHLLSPSHHQHVEREGQLLLETLTHYTNQFYGAAKTVTFADNSGLIIPERPGVPQVDSIPGLEDALSATFCCVDLDARIADEGSIEAQLVFPAECFPVQAIQLRTWRRTWPIASSIRTPLPDSIIRRALVWCGSATMTEEMEADFVASVLRSSGVDVEVVFAKNEDVQTFMSAYSRVDLDLVWIISHGELDHWRPHEVKLQISQDNGMVDLETLWGATPRRDNRRLLVLNVCDGGRHTETGFVPRVGLAPSLAGPSQATISHLWPVQPFPSAAFGACLALSLAKGLSFFDSYTDAMIRAQSEPSVLAEHLRSEAGEDLELPKRLANRTDQLTSMQLWGSAVFYQ